ncbi:hypothetical protein D210916BOD24_11810 [Alteromonas sp. D210916BOD_24]|uniref:DUF349 domain-containing protein n=1 Tax=Alteromonas sp. D210916BOD_24 TaxID=3157618 RepID=UPI00399CC23B
MIFSRIFAPSYQSPKPEKRIQAIEDLSPDKAQEKTILHELAFNDENPTVSLAALEKLNSFVLWLKMSQIAKQSRVKKVAERKVNDALVGESSLSLEQSEKAAFLTETANAELVTQLVPQMLERDPTLLHDEHLAKLLIEKVNKPVFTQYVFFDGANERLQRLLIGEESDINVLQKWARKVTQSDLQQLISTRIEALNALMQKPFELKKKLTLALSKYQALLDKSDVAQILEKQTELESELEELFSQSDIMNDEDKSQFDAKYQRITEQVTRYLNRLRPAWEDKQRLSALANTKALCEQQLSHAQTQVDWLYSQRLCEATLADVATVNESVRGVEATLEQLARMDNDAANENRVAEIVDAVSVLNAKLDSFSMQQQYGQKLLIKLQHLESLSQKIANNEERTADDKAAFESTKQDYLVLAKELTFVPREMAKRFTQISKHVISLEKAKDRKNAERVKHVRKQISVLENLIDQGKFRVALGKFRKLQESYESLESDIKGQVQKRFDKVSHDVARLEGWQDYLAAPRKPALVEEAQALAGAPVENVKARSEAIKYLRQQWLSLTAGNAVNIESQQADQLQVKFDEALEKAFEPCRDHYAKLDAQRIAAMEERKAIIDAVQSLDSNMPVAELAKNYDRISKQWLRAGQVERSAFEKLKLEWKQASSEVQTKVKNWQGENQAQKQVLVTQVKALVDAEDIQLAADEAQQLQVKWKNIGHAGKRDESKLWAEFKSANDAVFSRLKTEKKIQNSALNDRVVEMLKRVDCVDISADDTAFNAELSDITRLVADLPRSQRTKVERKIEHVQTARLNKVKDAQWLATKIRAQGLIDLLQGAQDAQQDILEKVGKRWAVLFEQASSDTSHKYDRHWLTVALEVATQMPSPDSDASVRSSVQLQMMTAKLEQGEAQTATDILTQWIGYDKVEQAEQALVGRVIVVLNAHPEVVA